KIGRNSGILLKGPSGPANVNGQVVAFDIAAFAHTLSKCVHHGGRGRGSRKNSDAGLPNRWSRILRPCRERPADQRAAEQRDQRPPLHSITSSARAMSIRGTSRPSALAVLKFMANKNFVGCKTGSSPGLAPWRIRPM